LLSLKKDVSVEEKVVIAEAKYVIAEKKVVMSEKQGYQGEWDELQNRQTTYCCYNTGYNQK
jgi:hypothetical protein